MADITVTPANVLPGAGAIVKPETFGATITQGKAVHKMANGRVGLFDANAAAPANKLYGVAMNSGADGQPADVLIGGKYNPGATVTVGGIYVGSATAGGIAPAADLATGHTVNVLGVATDTDEILVDIINSGVAVP